MDYRYNPQTSKKLFTYYSIYAWGVPVVILSFAAAADFTSIAPEYAPHYGHELCWFNNRKGLALFFVLPVGALILENLILFGLSALGIYRQNAAAKMASKSVRGNQDDLVKMRKKQNVEMRQQKRNKVRLVLYLKLALIMGLGWIFGFVAGLADVPWLWYVFFLFNGMQGVMIFVAFDVKKKIVNMVVERVLGRKVKLWSMDPRSRTTTMTSSGSSSATAKKNSQTSSSFQFRSSAQLQGNQKSYHDLPTITVGTLESDKASRKARASKTPEEDALAMDKAIGGHGLAVAKVKPTARDIEVDVHCEWPLLREEDSKVEETSRTAVTGQRQWEPTAPPKSSRKTSKTLSFLEDLEIPSRAANTSSKGQQVASGHVGEGNVKQPGTVNHGL